MQYFFGVRNKPQTINILLELINISLELIKRSSKVQENNMPRECALNFDQ